MLVVEADPTLRSHLSQLLKGWGYEPVATGSPHEALSLLLGSRHFLLSLVAIELDGADGVELLRQLKLQALEAGPVIMLFDSAHSQKIGEAAALGAEDFIVKPVKPEELENAINGLRVGTPRLNGRTQSEEVARRLGQEIGLWRSPRMKEVWNVIEQAAQVDITVLICGETGTGKDLVARAVHHHSFRQRRPFVKVNCAAVPRELLDEIGDLHPALQAKLLHVLQDGEFSRVGGRSTIKVDVRIIAATNQDLEKAVAAGRFREDLYYRLNVIQIVVPPLRERPTEIPPLVNYFAERYAKLFNREGFTVPAHVMEDLTQHSFPGNVRELENLIKRMIVLNDPLLGQLSLPRVKAGDDGNGAASRAQVQTLSLKQIARDAAQAAEREVMARVLEQTRWNRVKAAKLLRISYRALLYKIKQMGLESEARSVRART